MIRLITVEQDDPKTVVQSFIDLVGRHEQSFYSFVHNVHSKGQGLFDRLMHWVELFLTAAREGLGEKVSLEFILPHTGQDRVDVLKEIDAVALYHYKLKVLYEEKLRRRFRNAEGGDGTEGAEEEIGQALVDGVVRDLSFGELLKGGVDEIAAEDEDDDDDDYESETDSDDESSSEYETATESGSEQSIDDADASETVEPKPLARSITIGHPMQHGVQLQLQEPSHQNFQPRRSDSMSSPQRQYSHPRPQSQTPQPQSPRTRGRFANRDERGKEPPPPRSRSLHRIKSLLSMNKRNSDEVPPLPNLPAKHFPSSPLPRHMASSSTRSSLDSSNSSQRRQPPPASPHSAKKSKKRRKQATVLKPPELEHIPKLLPIFVEMVSSRLTKMK